MLEMMKQNQHSYFSYILRLWRVEGEEVQVGCEGESKFRASLDDPQTGDRVGFADLEALFDYIREVTKYANDDVLGNEIHKDSGRR
jgi:hypothetical protein